MLRAFLVLCLMFECGTPMPASAEEARTRFEIPSQNLATSLNQFAVAANWQLVFAPELVQNRRAPALVGNYTREDAIRHLLDGSGLVLRSLGGATYAVEAAQLAPASNRHNRNRPTRQH